MMAAVPGFFTQRVALGQSTFVLTLRYNARMDRWLMDVADANANTLLYGKPVLGSWPAFDRFHGIVAGLPVGSMVAFDLTGAGRDPQEDTLGNDVKLLYVDP